MTDRSTEELAVKTRSRHGNAASHGWIHSAAAYKHAVIGLIFLKYVSDSFAQLQIDPANLAGLIDLIATIPFQHADLHAKEAEGQMIQRVMPDLMGLKNTLLIDSEQLEFGDALDDNFRSMAADEIERFRREMHERSGNVRSVADITDQEHQSERRYHR